jgi:hypothetical protein
MLLAFAVMLSIERPVIVGFPNRRPTIKNVLMCAGVVLLFVAALAWNAIFFSAIVRVAQFLW